MCALGGFDPQVAQKMPLLSHAARLFGCVLASERSSAAWRAPVPRVARTAL